MQFAWGYIPTLVLEAAITHNVFDTLDSGPKTIQQVHEATSASVRGLAAIMNALVGLNFLAKTGSNGDALYSLTPESSTFLVSTKPSFQGGILRHTSRQLMPNFLHLNEVVATGKPVQAVNQEGDGTEFFHKFVVDILPHELPRGPDARASTSTSAPASSQPAHSISPPAPESGESPSHKAHPPSTSLPSTGPTSLPTTQEVVARFGLTNQFSFSPAT